jgi:hypothetical protein
VDRSQSIDRRRRHSGQRRVSQHHDGFPGRLACPRRRLHARRRLHGRPGTRALAQF